MEPPSSGRPVHPLNQVPEHHPHPPIEDVSILRPRINFTEKQVRLTYILIGINVIVFILDYFLNSSLTLLGMKENASIAAGQYWRILTPVFLHGGILHLLFNNYFLYVMGPRIESSFGMLRFAAIYFLSSMTGVILSYLLNDRPTIGASGALFGLMGAMIPYLLKNRRVLRNSDQMLKAVLQTIGINLLIGLTPGIDNWAHLGGLLGGAALSLIVSPWYALRMESDGSITIHDKITGRQVFLGILAGFAAVFALFTVANLLR